MSDSLVDQVAEIVKAEESKAQDKETESNVKSVTDSASDIEIPGEEELDNLFSDQSEYYNWASLLTILAMLGAFVGMFDFLASRDITRALLVIVASLALSAGSYYVIQAKVALFCSKGKVLRIFFLRRGGLYRDRDVVCHWYEKPRLSFDMHEEYMKLARDGAKEARMAKPGRDAHVYDIYTHNCLPLKHEDPNYPGEKFGKFILIVTDGKMEDYIAWSNQGVFINNTFLDQSACIMEVNILACVNKIPRCFLVSGSGRTIQAFSVSREIIALGFRDILLLNSKLKKEIAAKDREIQGHDEIYRYQLLSSKQQRVRTANTVCNYGLFDKKMVEKDMREVEKTSKGVFQKPKTSIAIIIVACIITALFSTLILKGL